MRFSTCGLFRARDLTHVLSFGVGVVVEKAALHFDHRNEAFFFFFYLYF